MTIRYNTIEGCLFFDSPISEATKIYLEALRSNLGSRVRFMDTYICIDALPAPLEIDPLLDLIAKTVYSATGSINLHGNDGDQQIIDFFRVSNGILIRERGRYRRLESEVVTSSAKQNYPTSDLVVYAGQLSIATPLPESKAMQLKTFIMHEMAFQLNDNGITVGCEGRDVGREFLNLLTEIARIIQDAEGEIECELNMDADHTILEYYSIKNGLLIRTPCVFERTIILSSGVAN